MRPIFLLSIAVLTGCVAPRDAAPRPDSDPNVGIIRTMAARMQHPLTDTQLQEMATNPLGTAKNPVRVEGVSGEYKYLARLRCPENKPPIVERRGSAADMSPYGSIMDIYSVTCDAATTTIFIDMYHPAHVESAAVPGFTIVPPP